MRTPEAEAIMQTAFAQIAALGVEARARQQRIDTDPTMIRLRAEAASLRPPTYPAHGTLGGMQVFTWLASPEAAELSRVNALIRARLADLSRTIPATQRAA